CYLRELQASVQPGLDVAHHLLTANVGQKIVIVTLVQRQGLVFRASRFIEELAALTDGCFVVRAVKDQQRQGDRWALVVKPFVCADQRGDGGGRLDLVRDQGIAVQRGDHFWITGEIFVLELQDRQARCKVTDPLDGREREPRRRYLEGEALAN